MDPVPMDESWVSTTHEVGVDYFDSKLAGEEVARSWEAKGLEVVVARPGIVLGPGDKLGSSAGTILRMARGTLPASVPGGGSYCDVRDVAAALAEAVEGEHAGRTYVLGGHNVSMRDMARKVSDLTGVPPPRQVPYWLMIAVAFVLEVIAVIRGTRAPVSRQLVRGARRYTFMDCTRARNELGYTNRPLDETLRETLRFFLEVEMLKPSTPQLEALRAD